MAGSVGQYTMGWFSWVAHQTEVGTWARANDNFLGMGELYTDPGAQNNEITRSLYLDSVTWKYALVYHQATLRGIVTLRLDGSSVGTVDMYGATTPNIYGEITGISVTTAGVKSVKETLATKNASSSGYSAYFQSFALIRTGGTPSTPAGTDTPGYTWEWIPWMGSKGNTNVNARNQGSDKLAGGTLGNGGTSGDQVNADMWAEARTYKITTIGSTASTEGIWTLRFDSTDLATQDHYSASGVPNVVTESTGIANATVGVKNFKIISNTKNASASGFGIIVNSVKIISTGA